MLMLGVGPICSRSGTSSVTQIFVGGPNPGNHFKLRGWQPAHNQRPEWLVLWRVCIPSFHASSLIFCKSGCVIMAAQSQTLFTDFNYDLASDFESEDPKQYEGCLTFGVLGTRSCRIPYCDCLLLTCTLVSIHFEIYSFIFIRTRRRRRLFNLEIDTQYVDEVYIRPDNED